MTQGAADVLVNQRDRIEWTDGLTVRGLLERMRYTFPMVIVTIDGAVVENEDYATRLVPPGADVRVIHLMSGG